MDKLQQLYDLMLEQGLLTSDISLEQFRSADDSQQEALYNLSLNEGIITPGVVSNADFKAAWSDSAQRISDFNEELKESKENVVELQRQEKERATAREMAPPEAVVETTAGVAVAPPIVEAQPKSVGQKISQDVAEYSYKTPDEIAVIDREKQEETLQRIQRRNEGFYDDRGLIDSIFSREKLSEIEGLDIEEFKEFMIDSGRLEEIRDKAERGLYEKEFGTKQDPQLAYDFDKYSAINEFLTSKLSKEYTEAYYNKQKQNGGYATILSREETPKLKVNQEKLKSYINNEMLVLTEKLKEQEAENQELVKRYEDDKLNGGYKIKQGLNKGWKGFEKGVSATAITFYNMIGAENIADALKAQAIQGKIFDPYDATYGYASGKQVFVDGIEYIVDERGQIYDKSKKLRVTGLIDKKKASNIIRQASKTKRDDWSMSGLGMASNLSNVLGDIGWQIAYQAALIGGGRIIGSVAKLTAPGRVAVSSLRKIPIKKSVASAIIAQSTLGYSRGLRDIYVAAKENGISDREAEELASLGAQQMGLLYGLTAPIATRTRVTDKILGEPTKEITKKAVREYLKTGKKGFLDVIGNARRNLGTYGLEGFKELVQENVQQAGEKFVVNPDINKEAGRKILDDTITMDDFINTSILSFLAGGMLPAGIDISTDTYSLFKDGSIAKMESLAFLSQDQDKTMELVNSQVAKGLYTQSQADKLLSDINVYRTTIGRMPKSTSPQAASVMMSDMAELYDLEQQKKNTDPVFHSEIDSKMSNIKARIQSTIEFDQLSSESKLQFTEEAIKKLQAEKDPETSWEITADETFNEARKLYYQYKTDFSEFDVTEEQATQSLVDEGVTEPTSEQVTARRKELIFKNLDDAIQKREARDIPDAEPAEAVQEVEEEVRVAPEEEVKEERLTDSQIPKSKTVYTAKADDDTTDTIEVTTRLDGSRDIVYKNEQGGVYQREKLSPDNTLTNEEYISNVVGDVTGSEDIALEDVMNPKMRERLSARQRAELGIEEEVAPDEAAMSSRMRVVGTNPLSSIEVSEDFDDIAAQRREKNKAITRLMRDGEITVEEAIELREESFNNVNEAQRLFEIRKQEAAPEAEVDELEDLERALRDEEVKFLKGQTSAIETQEASEQLVEEMNNLEIINEGVVVPDPEERVAISVEGVTERDGIIADEIPTVRIEDYNGIPMVSTISDQLVSGNVENPYTGNTIDNLKGGMFYSFTEGNEGLGWTYKDTKKGGEFLTAAKKAYEKNPEAYKKAWADGRIPNNHVLVQVVKMSQDSILSNEALYRVLVDNVSTLPKKNQTKAMTVLRQDLKTQINNKKDKQDANTQKEVAAYTEFLNIIKGKKNIIEAIELIPQLNVDARPYIIKRITNGSINEAGKPLPRLIKPRKAVPKALLEGVEGKNELTNIAYIADIITEPAHKNVPKRHVMAITSVDISENGGVVEGNHPNYKGAIKGEFLGVVEESAALKDLYPKAYANVVKGIIGKEAAGKEAKVGIEISQNIPVQLGLTDLIFRGMVMNLNQSDFSKLTGFLSLSFPSTNFYTDQDTFQTVIESDGVRKYIKDGEIVYGLTANGDIYLNPEFESFNTPIHEMGHIWTDFIEENSPALFNRGIKLVEGTKALETAKKDLGDTLAARKEALAILIGNRGQEITDAAQRSKFQEWLVALWKYVKEKFKSLRGLNQEQIENLTLAEFIDGALADILGGQEISKAKIKGKNDIEVAFQKAEENIYDIINKARNLNFKDNVIKSFLKKKGFTATEINEALNLPIDSLKNLPASFRNVEGGIKVGLPLYEKVYKYAQKQVGKSRTKENIDKAIDKAITYLQKQKDFKAQDDITADALVREFQRSLGRRLKRSPRLEELEYEGQLVTQLSNRDEIRVIKQRIKDSSAKSLQKIKSDIRTFMRKNLPRAEYGKAEVTKMVSLVTNAKTPNDLESATEQVIDFIYKKKADLSAARIANILKGKYERIQSGRRVGVKISPEANERIKVIAGNMVSEDVETKNQALVDAINELQTKTDLTQQDIEEIVNLETALMYNEAMQMDDSNPSKLHNLMRVNLNLARIIEQGRTERAEELAEESARKKEIISRGFEDITGMPFTDVDGIENEADRKAVMDEKIKNNAILRAKKRERESSLKLVRSINTFIASNEDLDGLIDIVSKSTGDYMGGALQELISEKEFDSRNEYKKRNLELKQELGDKLEEIFGKRYAKIIKPFSKETEVLNIDEDTEIPISQNKMMYLYNQYKDEANHPGFEASFGSKYAEVMEQLNQKLDPRLKEFADYQVNVLFPRLYNDYNQVYRKIYKTNLPWNRKYAGRLYRDGDTLENLDLMANPAVYKASIGGASTKARVKNKRPIQAVDGIDMLVSYLNDMEFFRAYAENLKDINTLVGNSDVKLAIEATSGPDVYNLLQDKLQKIANRGSMKGNQVRIINIMNDTFVLSRLGVNPTVAIKQLTSTTAYASDIGFRNWTKYAAKAMPNIKSVTKEILDNSVYLNDRYSTSIKNVLEAYNTGEVAKMSPIKGKSWADILMYLVKQGDKGAILLGGAPNYLYHKDQYKSKNPNASEDEVVKYAIRKFERETDKAQQSSDIASKDLFQTGDPLARAFNLFLTTPKQYQRKENSAIRNLYRKMRGMPSKGTFKENLRTLFVYHVWLPVVFQYVTLGLPGLLSGFEKEDKEDLIRAAILGNLNAFFIVGGLISTIADYIQGKPWAGRVQTLPIISVPQEIFSDANKAVTSKKQETRDKYTEKLIQQILMLTGIPASTLSKLGKNWADVVTGETDGAQETILKLLGYSDYIIEGPKDNKKAKSKTSAKKDMTEQEKAIQKMLDEIEKEKGK